MTTKMSILWSKKIFMIIISDVLEVCWMLRRQAAPSSLATNVFGSSGCVVHQYELLLRFSAE